MIRLRQIEIEIEKDNEEELIKKCEKKLNTKIRNYKINKKSIDARRKPDIFYSYEVDVDVDNEKKTLHKIKNDNIFKTPLEKYKYEITGDKLLTNRPVIVGSGPAGLFCAYLLAENGYNPIIIERGKAVEERVKDVEEFFNSGKLDTSSNVQFGEGGAGTFSDGKLNTLKKDKEFRQKKVFEIFVECGAPKEILYESHPHIGTNILIDVVKNMRKKIIKNGGKFKFSTCLTNLVIENNKLKRIEVNNSRYIDTDILILAIGHSARDTFRMLYQNGIDIESKPFAVGVRIQHKREMIDKCQYGEKYKLLKSANYKLTYKAKNNRGVYTFCMCPGGYVINSSSEDERLVINGMSNYERDSENSNSAVIVTVNEDDFGTNPLDGIKFQEELERLAYLNGKGKIPTQLYKDFKDNKISKEFGNINPIFKGSYELTNLNKFLPEFITESVIEAIEYWNNKIDVFSSDDAIISAIESRTSSPVRIVRNDKYLSNILGIYPIGEGAGYAGGITSSAIDGVKAFEAIIKEYRN